VRSRTQIQPPGFIAPCLPSKVDRPPDGDGWIHEIKYDGFRLQARRRPADVQLFTRNGYNWTARFPNIERAIAALRCTSCVLDGEVVSCDEKGIPDFQALRRRGPALLYVFDLLELDGKDLRRDPIEERKGALAKLIRQPTQRNGSAAPPTILFSEQIDAPADIAFQHICKLGLEGIVSKRRGSTYESGRSDRWLKTINPNAPSVVRLLDENWNQ
jgi:bifunctional non-homologous end joining protein LigD